MLKEQMAEMIGEMCEPADRMCNENCPSCDDKTQKIPNLFKAELSNLTVIDWEEIQKETRLSFGEKAQKEIEKVVLAKLHHIKEYL